MRGRLKALERVHREHVHLAWNIGWLTRADVKKYPKLESLLPAQGGPAVKQTAAEGRAALASWKQAVALRNAPRPRRAPTPTP